MHSPRHPHYYWLKKRGVRLRIAFLISLGMVLLAFQWTAPLPEAPPVREPDTVIIIMDSVIRTQHNNPREIPPDNTPRPLEKIDLKIVTEGPELIADLNLDSDELLPDLVVTSSGPEPEADETPPIIWAPEVMPEFPGGKEAMYAYLRLHLRYPYYDRQIDRQGTVYLLFVVDEEGRITDIEVQDSPSNTLAAEAIRVVKSMPRWSPGRQGGHFVKVYYNLPISFTLH